MINNELKLTFDDNFDIDVQKKFLSLLIFDQKWATIDGFNIIKPDLFENRILFLICRWMNDYYKQYKNVPTKIALIEILKTEKVKKGWNMNDYYSFTEVIDEIYTLSDSEDLEFFKEKVIDFVRQISWKKALIKGGSVFSAGNYEEAINAFKKVLSIGSENDLGYDLEEMATDDFLDLLGESYDTSNMLKTGIPGWDKALGGGFVKKNVHIIGAPPGAGKSRIMAFLAKKAVEDGKRVIFITLELSEAETIANIYTSVTGIGIHEMLDPINRDEFKEKVANFKDRYGMNLIVKFYKPASITTDTIHNFIYKIIQLKEEKHNIKWQPDVIFIDYMDKMLPTQKVKGNSYEDMGNVATDCKNLGISFDCPVITGSQLGRYTWTLQGDSVVSMDSIAESAQKVHIAHSLTTINSNKGENELRKCRLYLAKSRSGTPGKVIWCEKNLGKCKLYEIDPWDPKELETSANFSIKTALTK